MTKQENSYQPIDCGLHSSYELAIMHKLMLQLCWTETDGQRRVANVLPLDLITREHCEYLIGQTNDGELHHIRLDRISHSNVNEVIR